MYDMITYSKTGIRRYTSFASYINSIFKLDWIYLCMRIPNLVNESDAISELQIMRIQITHNIFKQFKKKTTEQI